MLAEERQRGLELGVGVETSLDRPELTGCMFERGQEVRSEPATASGRREPDPFQLSGLRVEQLDAAASDGRRVAVTHDEERAARRRHLLRLGTHRKGGVEVVREQRLDLVEVGLHQRPRLSAVRSYGLDARHASVSPAWWRVSDLVVRVEGAVEAAPGAGARAGLDRTVDAVAPEHHVAHTGEVASPYDVAVRQCHLGPRGDVAPRLDDAVVAERDADAGVGPEQAALAE